MQEKKADEKEGEKKGRNAEWIVGSKEEIISDFEEFIFAQPLLPGILETTR